MFRNYFKIAHFNLVSDLSMEAHNNKFCYIFIRNILFPAYEHQRFLHKACLSRLSTATGSSRFLEESCTLKNIRSLEVFPDVATKGMFFSNSTKIQFTCWNCNTVLSRADVFCTSCNVLQEPDPSLSYFDVLQQPMQFDLKIDDITKKFRELQWQLHPDKFVTRSEREQNLSAQYSSLVNKAYQTLLKPLDRGLYLLKLNNKPLEEETQVDNELLMHIMEINEEIAEPVSKDRLRELKQENNRVMKEIMNNISEAFRQNRLDDARKFLARFKYFVNIDAKLIDLFQKNA